MAVNYWSCFYFELFSTLIYIYILTWHFTPTKVVYFTEELYKNFFTNHSTTGSFRLYIYMYRYLGQGPVSPGSLVITACCLLHPIHPDKGQHLDVRIPHSR